jgi:NAD(P)-dependent dehydrogenase (short-subunit alcohol dehydrogenase family)
MVKMRQRRSKPHALVVGGTRGAGRQAVRRLVADGYRVSVLSRDPPAQSKQKPPAVRYWQADLGDPASLEPALTAINATHGALDCIAFFQRFRGTADAWQGEIETSLTGTAALIELLVGKFNLRNAAIVIVSSINASLISKHLPLGYHVAKAGLNQIVRYYAVTLGSRGIRVNSVSPGTFLKEESRDAVLSNHKLVALYQRIIPLGRIGTADEVVDAVTFLAGTRSSFITGQDLVVDGGLSLVFQEALACELVPTGTSVRSAKK